jgi:ribosomal protein S18 acetylase RimI-like enzyme
VGSLFAASTLPKARGRGAQSALVAARVRAAAELGLRWLVVETAQEVPEGNSSLHNVRRLGFETQYERGQWVWSPKG